MLKVNIHFLEEDCELSVPINCRLFLGDKQVGTSEVYLIHGGEYLAGYLDQADYHSEWVPYEAMASIDFDGEKGLTQNIGYIHKLIISEEFRGRGYATFFLNEIEKAASENGMETMILQPYPLERDTPAFHFSHIESLIAFYRRKGYECYPTEQAKNSPYFFKELTKVGVGPYIQ